MSVQMRRNESPIFRRSPSSAGGTLPGAGRLGLASAGSGDPGGPAGPGPEMASGGRGCPGGGEKVRDGVPPAGRPARSRADSRPDRRFLPGSGGDRRRFVRGGGRRRIPGDGVERLDDQVEQTDQQCRQPIPAAVRGQALGEPAELLGEPVLRGLRGWGAGVHIALLEYLANLVKKDFLGSPRSLGLRFATRPSLSRPREHRRRIGVPKFADEKPWRAQVAAASSRKGRRSRRKQTALQLLHLRVVGLGELPAEHRLEIILRLAHDVLVGGAEQLPGAGAAGGGQDAVQHSRG
jgi:hypothetical protein